MSNSDPPHSRPVPHLDGFLVFLTEFNKETDRGAALAAAAMIDELLRRVLSGFLVANKGAKALLDGFNAPLGTLSSRIAASFALGLISEREHRECELIRKIRNEFAHQVKVSFESAKVLGLCSQLQMAAQDYGNVEVDTRGRFTTAAVALVLHLTNRPHYAEQRRLAAQDWPY